MNTFEKSQSSKILACYVSAEDLQKASADEITMTKKEFKEEHERLLNVLESPSKQDDKEEAKKQEKEAEEYGVDLEKGHPVGYINAHGKQKQADGSWKHVGKNKTSSTEHEAQKLKERLAAERKTPLTRPKSLLTASEGELKSKDGEELYYRVYKDGGVKIEGADMWENFESKEDADKYINDHNITKR